ncbi:MAG: hypothetical protein ACRDTS_25300 [Mycobacterium sp.]
MTVTVVGCGRFVRWKLAGSAIPAATAVITYALVLANPFALAVTTAAPSLPVMAAPDESVALAPPAGAVKVTLTPGTGLLYASSTLTPSGVAKAAPMGVDCPLPDATARLTGAAGVTVTAAVAGVALPARAV